MINLNWLEARAYESGEPVGVQINGHLLAALWIDERLVWALDGEAIGPKEAKALLDTYT